MPVDIGIGSTYIFQFVSLLKYEFHQLYRQTFDFTTFDFTTFDFTTFDFTDFRLYDFRLYDFRLYRLYCL